VFYIEPYEKSLALKLHEDAIVSDPDHDDASDRRVRFLHFEGVAPRQYQDLFGPRLERKDDVGRLKVANRATAVQIAPQYLNSYLDFEKKVFEHLDDLHLKEVVLATDL
jgi:hypothetical protein